MIHIRKPYAPQSQQAIELPSDIVWMRLATRLLAGALLLALLGLGLRAFVLAPWFSLQRMVVRGASSYDTQFHNALALRANVLPSLTGNYFTISLGEVQKRFESLPWIRTATIQRVFPNTLAVTLTAHVPVARWGAAAQGESDTEHLLSEDGHIFEASGGQVETDELPHLAGPQGSAAQVLALYRLLQTRLSTSFLHQDVMDLSQSQQGLWLAKLSGGAQLKLGGGTQAQVMERLERWLEVAPEIARRYSANPLRSLDLRYPNGFAVQLAGVSTRSKN